MSDYAVKITVRNGRILRRMEEMGFESQTSLARAAGVSMQSLNAIIALRQSPTSANGDLRDIVLNVAAALKCDPDDLFNDRQRTLAVKANTQEVYMDEPELARLASGADMESAAFAKLQVQRLLADLPERAQKVLRCRMEGGTLEDIGDELGVTGQRIRQIEAKALRQLRYRVTADDRRVNECIAFGT